MAELSLVGLFYQNLKFEQDVHTQHGLKWMKSLEVHSGGQNGKCSTFSKLEEKGFFGILDPTPLLVG